MLSEQNDFAGFFFQKPCQDSPDSAFARSVGANQGNHFSLMTLKVNILSYNRFTKRVVQLFHFQNNLAGCRRRDFRLLNLMQVRSAKSQCLDFLISQSFHLLCGKFPHNFSFLHTQEAICQIHQIIKPMFCYDNGFSLLFQIADNVRKAISRCNIQIGGWFIHDIDFRVNRLCRCNRNLLAHSIGQAVQAMIRSNWLCPMIMAS